MLPPHLGVLVVLEAKFLLPTKGENIKTNERKGLEERLKSKQNSRKGRKYRQRGLWNWGVLGGLGTGRFPGRRSGAALGKWKFGPIFLWEFSPTHKIFRV